MSNETTPQMIMCPIKSFESDGNEGLSVTLKIPEHVADAVVKASTSRGPMLRVLVKAAPVQDDEKWASWQIAERAVIRGPQGNVALMDGARSLCWIGNSAVDCTSGNELDTVRVWLADLIREGYKAGVESVAQTKADGAAALVETYGPDALAKARAEGYETGKMEGAMDRSEAEGLREANRDLTNEVTNLRRALENAVEREKTVREEGRRQGQDEIIAYFDSTAEQHTSARDSKQREAHSLRAQATRLDEEARVRQATADMARGVAKELRSLTAKEPA